MTSIPHGITARQMLGALSVLPALGALARAQQPQQGDPTETLAKLSYPRVFVLTRHAEKGPEPVEDPILSEAGAERAKRLWELLQSAGVTHLFASEFMRTQQTLGLLRVNSGLNLQIVPALQPAALLSALESLPRGSLAVVSGHSNTIPPLVERLSGGQKKVTIGEAEYGRLFVVTQWGAGRASFAFELRC